MSAPINSREVPILGQCETGEHLTIKVGRAAGTRDGIALQLEHVGAIATVQSVILTPEQCAMLIELLEQALGAASPIQRVPVIERGS